MGSARALEVPPRFEVRAVGSFEQLPGCPEPAAEALGPAGLERLCRGECYHPAETRRRITRIEVVRIRPGRRGDASERIEDPWRVFGCPDSEAGCRVEFEDPDFDTAARDTVYYVRAIEAPSLAINGRNLRCTYDQEGRCESTRPCTGPADDDCLESVEQRAWSSPIFVDWAIP
jgi:hypothetical protein